MKFNGGRGAFLGSVDEVFVDGSAQHEPSLIGQVKHSQSVSFPLLLPSVCFQMDGLNLAMLICVLLGGDPSAMFVDTRIIGPAILDVHTVDHTVNPIYFLYLVNIVGGFRPVILKPGQLGWVQEGADCDGVGHLVLVGQPVDIVNKLLDSVDI